jgi:uncharacterized membrane protein YeaQ/YmgE (transglycosylase-associated protein family)
MGLLLFLIFGFIVGLVARALMPGPNPMGLVLTTLLGIAGAFLGGWLGQVFGLYHSYDRVHPAGFVMSILGAIIVLFVANAFWRGRGRRRVV